MTERNDDIGFLYECPPGYKRGPNEIDGMLFEDIDGDGPMISTFRRRGDIFNPTASMIIRRVVCGIQGFRNRYGHWPTKIRTYQELTDTLRADLTTAGYAAIVVKARFELVDDLMDVVAADDAGHEWSYGSNEIPQDVDEATRWLWGIELNPKLIYHPKLNDKGEKVRIYEPTTPTPLDEFGDPYMVATVIPGGPVPAELNGIQFEPWTDHPATDEDWVNVPGQIDLNEPPMFVPLSKHEATGVIVEEDDGRFWVIHPTNKFGGYSTTFAKGKLDKGLPRQANAIKEAYEESGLRVEITGFVGDVDRSTSFARYYLAKRVGGSPADMGWESQAVSLVPRDEIKDFLSAKVDRDLVRALVE